jgi:hypothetical protein
MITLKVSEAYLFLPSLQKVMRERLPAKAAYRLSRIAAKIDPELRLFEERRGKLAQEMGEEVKDRPGAFEVRGEENLKNFRAQLEELGSEEIKIDLEPLTVDMLGEAQLEAADLMALEKVIA